MEIEETNLADVWLIKPEINKDFRGDYVMTFHKFAIDQFLTQQGYQVNFVEQDISTSIKGVLRGIHYSPSCWKLNECLYGSLYYVVVNCDKESKEFGKWQSFILDDKSHHQILKHPRYGTGFYTLSDHAVFHYFQSEYYDPERPHQDTYPWQSPELNVWWPDKHPLLSRRDEIGRYES